jgi:hypothetical protein
MHWICQGCAAEAADHFDTGAVPVTVLLTAVLFVPTSPQPAIPSAARTKTVPSIQVIGLLAGSDLVGIAGGKGRESGVELS